VDIFTSAGYIVIIIIDLIILLPTINLKVKLYVIDVDMHLTSAFVMRIFILSVTLFKWIYELVTVRHVFFFNTSLSIAIFLVCLDNVVH